MDAVQVAKAMLVVVSKDGNGAHSHREDREGMTRNVDELVAVVLEWFGHKDQDG